MWEKLTHIKADEVKVYISGVISAKQLVDAVTIADVCVHPSYIENSSNTICEMQLLGCPVIATDVGGTSSLIKNRENGILILANDPYSIACQIVEIFKNKDKSIKIGKNGRLTAIKRHDPNCIIGDLMNTIRSIRKIN